MLLNAAAVALALASGAAAHSTMFGVWVNGVDQGDGRNVYIRSPPNNSPVKDLEISDIVCNVNGGTPVSSFVSAAAGDTLSFEWFHNTRNDDIIDLSHLGPIITYIAPFTEGDGAEPIWTKIAEEGFDPVARVWAVERLVANGGLHDFVLPANLAAGQYLIRQEIIAHHESETSFIANPARGAQFYPSCVQVEVTGSGTAIPDQNFDFNTGYTYEDPGILFNIYESFDSYPIPGPPVWDGSGAGSGSGDAPAPSPSPDAPATEAPAPTSTEAVAVPVVTETPAAPTTTSVAQPAPTRCAGRRRRRAARKL